MQTWNNWRGDSEKRFKFDAEFFKATLAWGVVPFTLYYVMASAERVRRVVHRYTALEADRSPFLMRRVYVCFCSQRGRDLRNGMPENFRQ